MPSPLIRAILTSYLERNWIAGDYARLLVCPMALQAITIAYERGCRFSEVKWTHFRED